MFSSDGAGEEVLSHIYGFIWSLGLLVKPHFCLLSLLVMLHWDHTSVAS